MEHVPNGVLLNVTVELAKLGETGAGPQLIPSSGTVTFTPFRVRDAASLAKLPVQGRFAACTNEHRGSLPEKLALFIDTAPLVLTFPVSVVVHGTERLPESSVVLPCAVIAPAGETVTALAMADTDMATAAAANGIYLDFWFFIFLFLFAYRQNALPVWASQASEITSCTARKSDNRCSAQSITTAPPCIGAPTS